MFMKSNTASLLQNLETFNNFQKELCVFYEAISAVSLQLPALSYVPYLFNCSWPFTNITIFLHKFNLNLGSEIIQA